MMVRLCALLATRYPELDAAYYQQDILRQPLDRALNWVYTWAVERVPSDRLDSWIADLHDLLPWQDVDSEAAINLESESFFAAQAKGGR